MTYEQNCNMLKAFFLFLIILFVKPLMADRGECVYLAVSLLCVSCVCLFSTSIAVDDTKGLWSACPSSSTSVGNHMFQTTFHSCICSCFPLLKWVLVRVCMCKRLGNIWRQRLLFSPCMLMDSGYCKLAC